MSDLDRQGIWLEVENARLEQGFNGNKIYFQLKGDKADRERVWWPLEFNGVDPSKDYREIGSALGKNQKVFARLGCRPPRPEDKISDCGQCLLAAIEYRVQHQ